MTTFCFIMGFVLLIALLIFGGIELTSLHDRVEELEEDIEKLKKEVK